MKNLALALITVAFTSLSAAGSSIEVLGADETKRLNLPFSEAVAIGDLLFLSGQIGSKPGELTLVEGGIQAETRQTMKNIIAILEKHGSSVDKLIKCTIFLGNMDEWGDMNIAYTEALGDHRPARSALGVSGIALGGSVEIECIAAR
ncbi:MAG: Rid family hydrolase [Gammaproteobacteria bacterium]|nr:Rid family hydrolase [Gammaproteobacteria bacterium]